MPEENAIRVIEGQPEVAAIEIPHEAGLDPTRTFADLDRSRDAAPSRIAPSHDGCSVPPTLPPSQERRERTAAPSAILPTALQSPLRGARMRCDRHRGANRRPT